MDPPGLQHLPRVHWADQSFPVGPREGGLGSVCFFLVSTVLHVEGDAITVGRDQTDWPMIPDQPGEQHFLSP